MGMHVNNKKIILAGLALPLALSLAACSKLTLENYGKIQVGMPEKEVFDLIGQPDKCDDVMVLRNCTWSSGDKTVNVSFTAHQVLLFSSQNLN